MGGILQDTDMDNGSGGGGDVQDVNNEDLSYADWKDGQVINIEHGKKAFTEKSNNNVSSNAALQKEARMTEDKQTMRYPRLLSFMPT